MADLDSVAVRSHVDHVVASDGFVRSKRLAAFLRWIVERALAGDTQSITERNIGIEVYQRGSDFEPKVDGTVRAEAIRLRHKLREYYNTAEDSPRIDVPKGAYIPVFTGFEVAEPAPSPEAIATARKPFVFPWRWAAAASTSAVALLARWFVYPQGGHGRAEAQRSSRQLTAEAARMIRIADNVAAADRGKQAIALTPEDSAPHRVLARAFMSLGRETDAVIEAHIAENLAPAHSRDAVEAAALRSTAELDTGRAVTRYRELAERDAKSFDLLLYLAQAQLRDHRYEDCLATLQRARRLPEMAGSVEVDRLEALALGNLAMLGQSTLPAALVSIGRAKSAAGASHSKAAMGRVLLLEGGLMSNAGRLPESIALLRYSRDICAEVHDDICVASTYRVDGNRMVSGGRYFEALRIYEQALPVALRWQNRLETANLLDGIRAATQGLRKYEGLATLASFSPRRPGN